jgi:hypothetical protein
MNNIAVCETLTFLTHGKHRHVVACAEITHQAMCLLSLDFTASFDSISHEYLYYIRRQYGLDNTVEIFKGLHTHTTSRCQINGQMSAAFPIKSSVRQGCPLSTFLYHLRINPLLTRLEAELTGLRLGVDTRAVVVISYADEVTTIVTEPANTRLLQNTLCS